MKALNLAGERGKETMLEESWMTGRCARVEKKNFWKESSQVHVGSCVLEGGGREPAERKGGERAWGEEGEGGRKNWEGKSSSWTLRQDRDNRRVCQERAGERWRERNIITHPLTHS